MYTQQRNYIIFFVLLFCLGLRFFERFAEPPTGKIPRPSTPVGELFLASFDRDAFCFLGPVCMTIDTFSSDNGALTSDNVSSSPDTVALTSDFVFPTPDFVSYENNF